MKAKEKTNAITPRKLIRVQLDHCTYATISRMSSLKAWKKRYPEAKVMA